MFSTKRSFPLSLLKGSVFSPTMRSTFVCAAALVTAVGISGCVVGAEDNDERTDNQEDEVASAAAGWQSSKVFFNSSGKLQYAADKEGNRIPDFSYVGYNQGASLPDVPVKLTISPASGDNTSSLQSAIDKVGAMPKDANGFRGTLLLKPGVYRTDNPVYVPFDGVVIRGSGSGSDPSKDTILKSSRTGEDPSVITLGPKSSNGDWQTKVSGSEVGITDAVVPMGQRWVTVANAGNFKVGDLVVVAHTPKSAWFSAIDNGGTHGDAGWSTSPDEFTIRYARFVTAISGNKITVDAPFYQTLKSIHGTLTLYKFDSSQSSNKIYRNVGIERLRVDIDTNGGTDESHTDSAIRFDGVVNGWARGVTMRYFKFAGVSISRSIGITVQDSFAGPPVSQITGGRRYNYNVSSGGQQVLFKSCIATDARHGFVSNGATTASGIVVLNSELRQNITGAEGHRRWTTGMLFDSSKVTSHASGSDSRGFAAYNRGNWGTSHGWGSVNSVLWNIDAVAGTQNIVQKPPTAQNWAIGVDGATGNGPFSEPGGFIEGTGQGATLNPPSLYQAQLADRK